MESLHLYKKKKKSRIDLSLFVLLRLGGQGPRQRQGEAHPVIQLGLTGHGTRLQCTCLEAAVVAAAHRWRRAAGGRETQVGFFFVCLVFSMLTLFQRFALC